MKITLTILNQKELSALFYFKRCIPKAFEHLLDAEKMYAKIKHIHSILHIKRRYDFEG